MATRTYDQVTMHPYSDKELLMSERFLPGELGMVILLEIGALLLWSVAIWGLTSDLTSMQEPAANTTYSAPVQ